MPFAIKSKLEETLKAQVEEGDLIPVEQSEWAAPIVVVHKHYEGLCVCGDFKVAINPVICPRFISTAHTKGAIQYLSQWGILFKVRLMSGLQTNEGRKK